MKRTITFTMILFLLGTLTEVNAQSKALKNGFSIKAQLGFPSANFGTVEDVGDEYTYGPAFGLQIGNQWYIKPQEKYGGGLMVNWIDGSGVQKKTDNALGEFQRATLDVSFLEIGPFGTYALSEAMAIDVYYNLRPTVMSSGYKIGNADSEAYGGFGFTHAFGADFRYSLLVVGVEYVMGKVKVSQDTTDPKIWEDEKINVDNFRILVGVKF